MARLVVNPGSPEAWDIHLKPGINSLGRGEENDFQLNQDSVSTSHCHICVADDRVVIKDLGSANGTFVDHTPVEESVLKPGHKIHIGTVELAYYPESGHSAAGVGGPAVQFDKLPVIFNEHKYCKIHLQTLASYYCDKCRGLFCQICVSSSPMNGVIHKLCRKCNRDCSPIKIEIVDEPEKGFYTQVPGAFLYPLRDAGILMLLVGTVLVGAVKFAAGMGKLNSSMHGAPPVSWWGLMLQVMVVGYMFCYMQNIIHSTALGETKMPSLPDITSFWEDILLPCLQLIGVTLISFAPLILFGIYLVTADARASGAVLMSFSALGCVYFPMAFLAVAMLDTVGAANPMLVLPSILKVPMEYVTALCVLALVFVARATGDVVLNFAFPKQLLTHSIGELALMLLLNMVWAFISFYLLTVGIRILGLLYVNRKETLGWLNH